MLVPRLAVAVAAALLLMATITRGSEGFVTLDEGAAMQSRAVDTRIQLEILEGQPRGTLVGSIPIKPGFTYRFNEPPREFTLEATTGEISTTIILDREVLRNDRYDLVVLSSQPTYPIEVRILVLDMNDNSPEFPEPSIAVSFSESAASGTRLLLDAATDLDIGNNGISDDYRIVDGNLDEKFKLVVTANPSGEITYLHLETTGKLDRETCSFYKLNVSARDGGSPPRFGFLLVNVTILDVNDNPPIFDHSDYIVSLNESVPSGTAVLQVMATDSDVGDNARITYYLSDTERQFTVDPETGIISTTEILDCPQQNCLENAHTRPGGAGCPKSCVFTVFARDHGSPRQDGRTYVTVNLVDANDHDPIIKFRYFPSNSAFATVDENAGNGSVVAAVSVVDHDQGLNGDTTVEIKTGNELNHFRLEYTPSFYLVRVHGILDREEINKYNLTIVATDKGSPPRTATSFLIIHVNDVNDHEPVFEKSEYSAILSELAPPGTYVAGITATDEDSGVNAQIYYSFVFGNEHQWFEMDPVSGLITTKTTLDREVQDTVELRISARDGGPNPKWAYSQLKVTILDENDERPTFSQQQINVSLSESTPGNTLVAMLTASDHDQGTNGSVTYLLDADVDGFYPDTFALDSLTGQLTTKSKLDRETIAFYEIRVIARDQGIPPQSSTATVFLTVLDVNDNSPQFYPQLYYVLFSETTISNQSPLVQVVATDRDEDERSMIRYSLAQPQHSKEFELDENTGILTVRNSFLVSAKDSFKLRVRARDLGERWADHDAEIELINEERLQNLEFDSSNGYEFSIGEDHGRQEASIGRQLGRIQVKPASFRREEELLYYAIIQGDPFYMFNINKNTGIITTSNVIDREQQSSYTLNVIARSTHGYGSTFVNITILDENDNAPAFFRPKDEIVIAENAAVGQEVFLARAKDLDSAINSRITYSLSYNPEQQFRIAESTGVLYLNRPINIKPGISINIEVTATDSGEVPLSSRHIISITVEDVNDHTPVFDHTSYETSLLESTPVNARFFAIRASDFDLGDNGQVKYTISEGDIEAKFGIFPDGFLYVRNPLDREERDYYSLVVTAMDHGNPPRSSSVPVVIHVIDENDNSPKFSNSTFVFYVRENEPPDSFVGKLIANDRDMGRNAELTFTLTNSQRDFAIDPKNGFIKTLHIFDREELVQSTGQSLLTLEAIVSDNGVIRLSDRVKINVYVTDENDNAPKFLRIPYKVQISEGASVGTQIFRVFTTDADEGLNGDVFYSISEGNQEGRFSIEETTGQILVAKTLDRESTSRYILTVIAQDAGLSVRLSSSVSVVIDILDENDNAPEFIETSPSIIVSEVTSVGTELIQFKATDADLDINSEVNFSIGAGNRRDTFHIDALTGTLYLHKPLDYEELTSYTLNITVSDGGNPRLSSTLLFQVTVEDANDNAPIFPNTAIVRQIREGIPVNTPIVTVTAEDPDSGVNGNVIYHISHEEPAGGGKHFGINPNSGVIHTLLPIDREAVDTFKLTVVAMDQALNESMRMSAEKLVTVIVEDVNDNAPLFVSMNAAVLPRKATEGTIVMHVLARDLDSSTNGLVTYEMVSGNTDLFRLHRSTGILSLRRTISSPTDNSDALMKYHIAVKATDEAVQAERKSTDAYVTLLSIDTERTGPIFDTAHLTGTVLENEPPGTNVVRIEASWPTGGQGTELEYYVTNVTSTSGRQLDRLFDIDTKMGVLSTTAELDREAGADVYVVEVFVVAVGMAAASSNKVTVTVLDKNDCPPSFRDIDRKYTVSEELAPGQQVATVKASDPDLLGTLSYILLDGGDGNFELESSTGVIRLKEPLDRERKDLYSLTVQASDGVQQTETILEIMVSDTNDNPPVFEESAYSFDIDENTPRGTRIGEVHAKDDDQGVNGQVTYSVISDWANDVFSLNPHTGAFTLTAHLDYEEVQHYIFVVQAQDSGRPSLSSTITVYFNVLDLNDNAPLFDPMSYSNEMFENATIGTSVVTVSATDLDSGENSHIVYSIISGDEENHFAMTSNGTIVTASKLDRETQSLYNIVVLARDNAIRPAQRLSSTVQVSIVLRDVNDMAPEFITPNETTVPENISTNTVVMAVKAIDRDEGRNSYIEYSLSQEPLVPTLFSLGPVDGLLRVVGRLDRETTPNYTLIVTAKDRGEPSLSSTSKILLRILDDNDNSPVFDPKHYSASIAENASIGASVLQVSATDFDEGPNGRLRFTISAGDENRDFIISEDTGVVRVAKNLNFERKNRYLVTVRAEDCPTSGPVRFDTASISISIGDINDNPPTFLDSPYLAYVMENVIPEPHGHVLTVEAFDADTPPYNSQIRYFLKEGDTGLFRVNGSNGEITLMRSLDREQQQEHILTLVAMDTGTPPLTGSGTVRVIVQDVNDHSPEFERKAYHALVQENLPAGTSVIQLRATDKDAGDNSKIRYSLLGEKISRFAVDSSTGLVTTRVVLDREEINMYQVTLLAQDSSATEPRATAVNLTVNVVDENDNAPRFSAPSYTVHIADDVKQGQFVFGAKAFDPDEGINSRVRFSLNGADATFFTIEPETGVIKWAREKENDGIINKSYYLDILAEDGGNPRNNATATLLVQLISGNKFPSIISPRYGRAEFVLSEDVRAGHVITQVSATSPKQSPLNRIYYAIAGGNVGDSLQVDANSGEVMVAGNGLDYEVWPEYTVWIEARDSDSPPLRTVLRLIINVTDANDNPPKLDNLIYNASILEEEYPPQFVISVHATDIDSGSNAELFYRLARDAEGSFEIDSIKGEISTKAKLDRESISSYQLIVEAIDKGKPQLTGTATVEVTVLDKNDNPPRFTRLFSVNVTENVDPGTFVIRLTSSDLDIGENANATYSFTENPSNKFAIDSTTGNVTVAGSLDREFQDEYLLKVAAVDGSWRAETPLTITIQDQNDNAPEFEYLEYNFNFPELQRNVVFVGQVTASDRDKQGPNSIISYSIKHPSDLFTIDPASGELFSKRSLRYKHTALESSPENQYILTIIATDNGKPPMSSECLVTVNVVDANNNAPKFERHEYLSPVPETAFVGQPIIQAVATDKHDFGVNAEIEYSKEGGNGTELFNIHPKTGWITVAQLLVGKLLKYYTLQVRAQDKGVPPLSDLTKITFVVSTENHFSPIFTALSYQVIVPENEPINSTILTVLASDGDQGPNGIVRYMISSGNERDEFAVSSKSGAVTIQQPLDFDTVQEYRLNITATDLGFEPRQATAMLTVTLTDINDNAPLFNQTSYEAFLQENSPIKSSVFQVQAKDIDSAKNAIIEYKIVGGSGKDVFDINSRTGLIISKMIFDFEEKNIYDLELVAANPDSNMYSATSVRVFITGQNEFFPHFIQPVFHLDVSESADVGTSVGLVQATDQDSGPDGDVYYLFVGSSNDRGFSIGTDTGIIRVSRRLDRETQNRVVLTVMAKNAGGIRGNDTDEAQVIISIQDGNDPPEFLEPLYIAEISEAASPGTKVLTVKAVDKDVRPQNNQFSYSIIGGNSGHAFKIEPQTGDIETTAKLDREEIASYALTIGAIDVGSPPQTGTTLVRITILDVNDNGPVLEPGPITGYVMENEPANTSVMTLAATDPDLPPNGAPFTYTIVGGLHKDLVVIERHTGVVKTARILDREATPQLDIMVEIEDAGDLPMSSQLPISIIVLDQNDSPSIPRSVHVLVHTFNDILPIGMIADVHPNDPDSTGDYHCKLVTSVPSMGILTIPNKCELHSSRANPRNDFTITVAGNDGRHPDVLSTVTVQFVTFDNLTIEHTLSIRLENHTTTRFLTHFYKDFLDILQTLFGPNDRPFLYAMREVNAGIELALAVKTGTSYRNKAQIGEILAAKTSLFNQLVRSPLIVPYSPCRSTNACLNGGYCTESLVVSEETSLASSQTLIFTSPMVRHEWTCRCTDSYTGPRCERRQEPCSPNPCYAGGTCRRHGFDFQCICPPTRDGKLCELERGDACQGNPCLNGGSCRESPDGASFFCLCRPGNRGNRCESAADSCRPNPCLHGGLCITLKPGGYRCACPDARYGRHCERSTYGFNELSFLSFSSLDATTNDISIVFATTKPNALLIYNYGPQTGGRSDFIAVELVNGKARFSYGGARTAITRMTVSGKGKTLADGLWHKVTAIRNGRVVSLSVADCTENGDLCNECKLDDPHCYSDDVGLAGTLNFNNQPVLVGGLIAADPVLERLGQLNSDDFVGCVHSVAVNGRLLNLSAPLSSRGVHPTCIRSAGRSPCSDIASSSVFTAKLTLGDSTSLPPTWPQKQYLSNSSTTTTMGLDSTSSSALGLISSEGTHLCGTGICLDHWTHAMCKCSSDVVAPDCQSSLDPITLTDGGYVEFTISSMHRRMQLLEMVYGGSTIWQKEKDELVKTNSRTIRHADGVDKSMSFMFRTVRPNGLLFYSATNKDYTSLELRTGKLIYISRVGVGRIPVNMTADMPSDGGMSDGRWHRVLLIARGRGLRLFVDSQLIGEELELAGVHDFLDPYLTTLTLGGTAAHEQRLEGCLANFSINAEIQPLNGTGSILGRAILHGGIISGCSGPIRFGQASAPDPLSIGITLVIVFFVILLVAILVSFLVFRLRRQKKEKEGPNASTTISGLGKSNGVGGVSLASGGSGLLSAQPPDMARGLHSSDASGFLTGDNGEVIRTVSGHHLVAPELISKKYKEREIVASEPRQQRPDIIEREVSKSIPLRDEHHPPLPPSQGQQIDQPGVSIDLEVPEHYDLENASSIAPSDIDIVYHYKGYREGGNVRKYKTTTPHLTAGPVTSYHHKHQGSQAGQQHRHSPHHATAFPPHSRDSPRAVVPLPPTSRVDSPGSVASNTNANKLLQHQSTPLARLSPSSELSQQAPRILTLQDISGKPLQSALLATTSSSGGVGKDALHSNSERSLNSPVMSQLSGQSSSPSRKAPPQDGTGVNGVGPMGLTAEEIERLNSRPRTSSLVSTLDAVSSSSEALRVGRGGPPPPSHHLNHLHPGSPTMADTHLDNNSSTTTDESGNDSFTCSEFEYDNNNEKRDGDHIFSKLEESERRSESTTNGGSGNKPPPLLPVSTSYDGFDSSFRGSLSTLVASDDDLSTHMGAPLYRPHNGSPSSTAALGWNYLLNWGPNFESLVGVFKDIAELPDSVNSRVAASLRLPSSGNKPSEEYV